MSYSADDSSVQNGSAAPTPAATASLAVLGAKRLKAKVSLNAACLDTYKVCAFQGIHLALERCISDTCLPL